MSNVSDLGMFERIFWRTAPRFHRIKIIKKKIKKNCLPANWGLGPLVVWEEIENSQTRPY
jgi:hypothetical protein